MRRREPDSAEFQRFLGRLGPDADAAWNEYQRLRRKLTKFFEWNACRDAENLACGALDRIARRPDVEQLRSIPEFAIGVARNMCKESHLKERRESYVDDDPAGADSLVDPRNYEADVAGRLDAAARLECLRTCLAKLDERDRTLAVEYYSAEGVRQSLHRTILAVRYRFTTNALRVHMNRLRDRLEGEVIECLKNRRGRGS